MIRDADGATRDGSRPIQLLQRMHFLYSLSADPQRPKPKHRILKQILLEAVGGQVFLELGQVDRPLPLAPLHHLAILEEDDGGQAVDAVLLHQVRVGVHLDLHNLQLVAVVGLLSLLHNLADQLARAAPGGPEVDEHGDVGLEDLLLPVRTGDLLDGAGGHAPPGVGPGGRASRGERAGGAQRALASQRGAHAVRGAERRSHRSHRSTVTR
mmetsp:Transcript_7318/g.32994  ORF Transcript_7318/g.32994 Transcript_7318/m.32994 type:complete len:211 (+) Transcript_7318:733-1365(+)